MSTLSGWCCDEDFTYITSSYLQNNPMATTTMPIPGGEAWAGGDGLICTGLAGNMFVSPGRQLQVTAQAFPVSEPAARLPLVQGWRGNLVYKQPENPHPGNPRPGNSQPRNPRPGNPQPRNPQPGNPQPGNLLAWEPSAWEPLGLGTPWPRNPSAWELSWPFII